MTLGTYCSNVKHTILHKSFPKHLASELAKTANGKYYSIIMSSFKIQLKVSEGRLKNSYIECEGVNTLKQQT